MTAKRKRAADGLMNQFQQHGAIALRDCIRPQQLSRLESGIAACLQQPTPLAREFAQSEAGSYHSDMYLHVFFEEFKAFVANLELGDFIAQAMKSITLTLFNLELLIKDPRTEVETPWHHDITYWPLQGKQVCSLWIPLDPVNRESGRLEFISGSHRTGKKYHPRDFDTGQPRITSTEEQPVRVNRNDLKHILLWDLDPGDALLFDASTLHRASGNASAERRRRAVVLRLVGDDVSFEPRPFTIPLIWAPNLKPGDRLSDDAALFPSLFPK